MLEAEHLYLEDHPIASPSSIVDGRPTCYRARRKTSDRWEFMAKLVWRESNQRAPEEEILRMVTDRQA
jgi:hypothetical protein